MNVNILTVVWGEQTIQNFLNYALPTFDNNGKIFNDKNFNLTIYTKAKDFKFFESIHLKNVTFEFIFRVRCKSTGQRQYRRA